MSHPVITKRNELLDKEEILNKNHTLRFLKIPGIYFLIRNNEIIYIGESENIINRIFEHNSNIIFDSFHFLRTLGLRKIQRLELERKYIKKFKPVYNKKSKT